MRPDSPGIWIHRPGSSGITSGEGGPLVADFGFFLGLDAVQVIALVFDHVVLPLVVMAMMSG